MVSGSGLVAIVYFHLQFCMVVTQAKPVTPQKKGTKPKTVPDIFIACLSVFKYLNLFTKTYVSTITNMFLPTFLRYVILFNSILK